MFIKILFVLQGLAFIALIIVEIKKHKLRKELRKIEEELRNIGKKL